MVMTIGDKVKYDGEKHLVVNILKDGSPVLVPMSVIDDECYAVGLDEIEELNEELDKPLGMFIDDEEWEKEMGR
jgi:hypothetical protein